MTIAATERAPGTRSNRPAVPVRLIGLLPPLALVIIWELCGQYHMLPRYLVPPSLIVSTTWRMLLSGELIGHIGASMFRIAMGFLIGSICGTAAGLISGSVRPVERFYEPLISLTYPVPKTAALPIIFAWFGLGDAAKIVAITLSIFYPCYIAAYYGAKSVAGIHIWSARNMGATRLQIFFRIVLPSALPQIFNGLRIAIGLSFIVMVTSELIAAQKGLGYLVGAAEDNMRFDIMWVAVVTIGIIGFCADRILLMIRSRVLMGQLLGKDQAHG